MVTVCLSLHLKIMNNFNT